MIVLKLTLDGMNVTGRSHVKSHFFYNRQSLNNAGLRLLINEDKRSCCELPGRGEFFLIR